MAVRNCAEIGENLIKIVKRLLANQDLLKLLYYTDKDPLNHDNISQETIEKEVFNQLIKIVPIQLPRDDMRSVLIIRVNNGYIMKGNTDFKQINLSIEVLVPPDAWMIKGTNLRPFAILGEVQKALDGKLINGLGRMESDSFHIQFITEEMIAYKQLYNIVSYD